MNKQNRIVNCIGYKYYEFCHFATVQIIPFCEITRPHCPKGLKSDSNCHEVSFKFCKRKDLEFGVIIFLIYLNIFFLNIKATIIYL